MVDWQDFFDAKPAILLPIAYFYVVDLRERKWILILALVGYTLSCVDAALRKYHKSTIPTTLVLTILSQIGVLHLPLNAVWLSSVFFIIGGSPTTGTTLLPTIIVDVPPEVRFVGFHLGSLQ